MIAREELDKLVEDIVRLAPYEAAELIEQRDDDAAAAALSEINPLVAQQIFHELGDQKRCEILAAATPEKARQWTRNEQYPEDSVGWLMEPPVAVFRPTTTVRDTIEALRKLIKKAFITYGYVTDESNKLLGMRSCCRAFRFRVRRRCPERCKIPATG